MEGRQSRGFSEPAAASCPQARGATRALLNSVAHPPARPPAEHLPSDRPGAKCGVEHRSEQRPLGLRSPPGGGHHHWKTALTHGGRCSGVAWHTAALLGPEPATSPWSACAASECGLRCPVPGRLSAAVVAVPAQASDQSCVLSPGPPGAWQGAGTALRGCPPPSSPLAPLRARPPAPVKCPFCTEPPLGLQQLRGCAGPPPAGSDLPPVCLPRQRSRTLGTARPASPLPLHAQRGFLRTEWAGGTDDNHRSLSVLLC